MFARALFGASSARAQAPLGAASLDGGGPVSAVPSSAAHGSEELFSQNDTQRFTIVGERSHEDPGQWLSDSPNADTGEVGQPPIARIPRDPSGRSYWPSGFTHDAVVELVSARGILCTGTIIRPRFVLSAAHCRAARAVLIARRDGRRIRIAIRRVVVPLARGIDVGLYELAANAPVKPYALRNRADDEAPRGTLRLVGFGVTDAETFAGAGVRRWADIVVHGWGCDASNAQRTGCEPSIEMVIRGSNGLDTCSGDSGGPALELSEGAPRIVGITSRGVEDGATPCGSGGVYTRVDRVQNWIERVIGR